ncbi:50S ribosomal protein L10 [Candidatus Pacearchaeota archaeon]|nr:50S ribosomal protein L10 [Candidatus Pacearchaeota archaeon]
MKEKKEIISTVSESKKKLVKELTMKMQRNRTVLLASCKGLPGKQFHEIKKKLRGAADLKVAKKSTISKAIEATEKGTLQQLKSNLQADYVLLFSDMEPFELSSMLIDFQSSRRAKTGDIAPYDIEVEPGPTELVAGPAISELGAVGLKVKVVEGKLEIIKGATVVKKGETIKANVASVLGKLNVSPMKVGFLPIAAFDGKEDKVYTDLMIDKPGTLESLREMVRKSFGFAIALKYPTKNTIKYFIAKAFAEEKAIGKLYVNDQPIKEDV